jgi:hypothetical protein
MDNQICNLSPPAAAERENTLLQTKKEEESTPEFSLDVFFTITHVKMVPSPKGAPSGDSPIKKCRAPAKRRGG